MTRSVTDRPAPYADTRWAGVRDADVFGVQARIRAVVRPRWIELDLVDLDDREA
jgi:hypothetical protein